MDKKLLGMALLACNVATACPITVGNQHVNLYDGSLGVSTSFVKTHAKHAVGITTGTGAFCSGTFLPGNLVLTASHCFGSSIAGLSVTFNYQLNNLGVLEVQENFPVIGVVERALLDYDYAILQIGSNASGVDPSSKFPVARLSEYIDPQVGSLYTSIGQSGGQPKKIDTGTFFRYQSRGWFETTGLETYGGASGGGILNSGGYLSSLELATGCDGSPVQQITGGHSLRELVRMSPTLKTLFSSYKNDWANRHTNDFNNGIRWSNIGTNNWVLSQDASGNKYAGFYVNTSSGVATEKKANLVTHPFTVHPSGNKKVNFDISVGRSVSATELNAYVLHGSTRTFLWKKALAASPSWSSVTESVELDLSAYNGTIKIEFEAVAFASTGASQVSVITLDNVVLPDFSPSLAPIVGVNNYVVSAWPSAMGAGIHAEGPLQSSGYLHGWHNAQWQFKVINGRYVKITNRHQSDKSLHMQYGYLELGAALDGWHSAHWELEAAPSYAASLMKAYRLKNRHTGLYLNMEGMALQASSVPEDYWSSYWLINEVKPLSGFKLCEFNDPVTGTTHGCTATSVGGGSGSVTYRIEKFGVVLLHVVVNNSACTVSVSGSSPSYYVTGNCSNYRIHYN